MYDNFTSFDDLVNKGTDYLKKSGRTGSLDKYRWTWRQIENFMGESPYGSLSAGVSEFIKEKYGSKNADGLSHYDKTCIRQALCLVQFAETGEMPARMEFVRREQAVLDGEIGARMAEFVAYKRSMRLHEKTLSGYRYYLYLLNKYLNGNGIDEVSRISPLVLLHYVSVLLPGTPGAK